LVIEGADLIVPSMSELPLSGLLHKVQ